MACSISPFRPDSNTVARPHPEPGSVIVTGTFDQWSSSIRLAKDSSGFKGSTQIPWDEKIAYKFIVDGEWSIAPSQPTETDSSGNVNNIYIAPSKPLPPPTTMSKTTANGDTPSSDDKQETEAGGGVSQVVSDLATAAAAGTAAGLGYVASGVGAAVQTVVGEDPEKTTTEVPAPEPISKAVSEPTPVSAPPEPETLPAPASVPPVVESPPAEERQAAPQPVSDPEPTPEPLAEPAPAAPAVAPIIPIAIVPVNAAENNESPPPSAETKEEASTHRPSSFSSTPAPAVVAAEVPPAPAEVPPAPVEAPPAPVEVSPEPAVAPTSSDVIEDKKSMPETPPTNGPAAEEDKPVSQPQLATPPPSAPSTPKKKEAFPSTESPSNSPSSSSKFGTSGSARKKRSSIFGKINIKHMFSPSKDKDKEKK
ncbi:hypothetical protein IW261DRAFT_1433403 [Armillaria novae-zelandiae]|uniref:AMP-activated protein kinase glycogen-binding domain-containing protein n=1 Tax=Armillaria novae-zelandiae TaxID=153914 RepID=A0AA39PVU2_9AGAR|nr:hypothetical protein IW261DRAFT_1433403 [Armillaria novae-zelandiae]